MAAGGSGRLKLSGGRFDVTVILRLLVAWCYQTVGILKNQLLRKKSTNNTLIALLVCQCAGQRQQRVVLQRLLRHATQCYARISPARP